MQHAQESGSGLHKVAIRGDDLMVSDGYHTLDELYEHRFELFIALARAMKKLTDSETTDWQPVWRSKLHSDGTAFEGWFVLGIGKEDGQQITYHLPEKRWADTDFAETLKNAPDFDHHTPDDVLKRLKKI